jgi:serine/threonine-protein kinase
MSHPKLPVQGELFRDRYLIECGLGGGFESQVLGASDRETGRRVAIKLWTGEHAEQAVASVRAFMRVAYESGLYEHPNLLEVFAAELDHGTGYCVSEWLEGTTLARALQRVRPAPLEDVFEHVLPCMRAIAEAHAAGIVHGDIRPGHIFLCRATRHRAARSRVFDFGRGMPGFQELRASKRPTLDEACHYTTPEQLQSAALDARSDQYAFGLLLYEMLAGELPFTADNGNDLALEIVAGAAQPLAELRRTLPPGLSDVVARAMAAEPAERYPDLLTLIEALEAFDPRQQSVAPRGMPHNVYHLRPEHAGFVPPPIGAYDWSQPDSSEPKAVSIPAQAPAPERNYTFLPKAALAGAVTAALISSLYLSLEPTARPAPPRQSRSHELHKPEPSGAATSYSAIQRAEHAAAPSAPANPAKPAPTSAAAKPAPAPGGAVTSLPNAPGAEPGSQPVSPQYLTVEPRGQTLPSALPELPPADQIPLLAPVQMQHGLALEAPLATPAHPSAPQLAAMSGSAPQPAAADFPAAAPAAEAPKSHAPAKPAAPRAAAVSEPAPAAAVKPVRRRSKTNAAEAIQRLDTSMQLQ